MRANINPIPNAIDLITNENGIVDIDTEEIENKGAISDAYYASAEYGYKNNWDSLPNIKLTDASFKSSPNTTVDIVIKESMKNFITGRKSKRWKQVGYSVNGNSPTSCDYRLIWEFIRGQDLAKIYNTKGCGIEGSFRGSNLWVINDKNGTISINETSQNIAPSAKFIILTDTEMRFSYTELGNFVEYAYQLE
jgi:hypothetical protein